MRSLVLLPAAALLLCSCDRGEQGPAARPERNAPSREQPGAASPAPAAPAVGWDLQSSGEGTALVLLSAPARATVRLFCPAGQRRLLVNVPAFQPIGSEERLSVGSGGLVVALVADTRGDRQRGGVSGTGTVPPDLASLIGGPLSVSYGRQTSGPHPVPPPGLSRAFVGACAEGSVAAPGPASPASPAVTPAGPCLMQGSERLQVAPLRAVGTEPFWGARIEGRCVTYSHPEDQQGTRVWTRYATVDGGGRWSGALGGQPFELRTRAQPGCSDGMSDRRYPIAVELLVGGERRTGCAEPI